MYVRAVCCCCCKSYFSVLTFNHFLKTSLTDFMKKSVLLSVIETEQPKGWEPRRVLFLLRLVPILPFTVHCLAEIMWWQNLGRRQEKHVTCGSSHCPALLGKGFLESAQETFLPIALRGQIQILADAPNGVQAFDKSDLFGCSCASIKELLTWWHISYRV